MDYYIHVISSSTLILYKLGISPDIIKEILKVVFIRDRTRCDHCNIDCYLCKKIIYTFSENNHWIFGDVDGKEKYVPICSGCYIIRKTKYANLM